MSKAKGPAMEHALARYLRPWWPHAEPVGAGRNGRDITGTPGVAFEVKTADNFKADFKPTAWVRQARAYAGSDVPVVIYYPRGVGEAHTDETLSILPTGWLMLVLEAAGYAPERKTE